MMIYGRAPEYAEAGWQIFPLPAGQKFPPPKGRTGADGRFPDLDTLTREAGDYPESNIAIRACDGIIGIDVDAYDGKPGLETLTRMAEELGELPPTIMSTSRTDDSGIRMFRIPEGVKLVTKLPGIEFVQQHHRYVVCWPSIHPEGRTYQWIDTGTGEILDRVPDVGDVPLLPEAWVEHLRIDARHSNGKSDADPSEIAEQLGRWCKAGTPCEHLEEALASAKEEVDTGNSRHDVCMKYQLLIIRLGESDHEGALTAMARLKNWFFEVIGDDRDVSKEWKDGWTGAARVVLNDPTPDRDKGCFLSASEGDGDSDGADDEDLGESKDGRVRINIGNRERAGRRLREELGTGELAGMFYRKGELVYTPRIGEEGYNAPSAGDDDGPAQVQMVNPQLLKTMIEIRYALGIGKRAKSEDGEGPGRMTWEPRTLPMEVANGLVQAACIREDVPNLRILAGVTHTPLVRKNGTILNKPGYDPETRMLYLPTGDTPRDLGNIDRDSVRESVQFLLSIVEQFPFVTETHRANWFGALFTPLLKVMLPPPYPAFVIDAPSPGAGKSYLSEIIRTVHGGALRAGWPATDEELSKSVLSMLMGTTAPVITFDNVRGTIRSATFESLLTSTDYKGRLLGFNREAEMPNDRLWMITANNAEIGGDLARRCYWVTIDPKMPRPHERTGFRINLREWVPENRVNILAALLTVVRGWVMAGSPKAELKRSDHYATWDAAIEGMLSWAGFPGQFGFVEEARQDSDDDREWLAFLNEVYRIMGDQTFRVRDLTGRIKESDGDMFPPEGSGSDQMDPALLPGDLADKWSRISLGNSHAGFNKSLGRWIKNRSGRYSGDLALVVKNDPKKGDTYKISRWGSAE
jgi:bifunctional DNA primase/polymerase-like protein